MKEIRNPKSEIRSKPGTPRLKCGRLTCAGSFGILPFQALSLLRISDFGFRIWLLPVLLLAAFFFLPSPALAQPANDNFASAQPLQGPSGTVTGNNNNATLETGEPVVPNTIGGGSIWFKWTAPANGAYTFNTFGSVITDTTLGIYTGNSVDNLTAIAQ